MRSIHLSVLLPICSLIAGTSTWDATSITNLDWGSNSNWIGGIPGVLGPSNESATFPSPLILNGQVLLNTGNTPLNVNLDTLSLNSHYIIQGAGSIAGIGSNPLNIQIQTNSITQIQVPISCPLPQALNISLPSNSQCTLTNTINLLNSQLTQNGKGSLIINGSIEAFETTGSGTLTCQSLTMQISNTGSIEAQSSINGTNSSIDVFNSNITLDGTIKSNRSGLDGDSALFFANSTINISTSGSALSTNSGSGILTSTFTFDNSDATIDGQISASGSTDISKINLLQSSLNLSKTGKILCTNNSATSGQSTIDFTQTTGVIDGLIQNTNSATLGGNAEITFDLSTLSSKSNSLPPTIESLRSNSTSSGDALISIKDSTLNAPSAKLSTINTAQAGLSKTTITNNSSIHANQIQSFNQCLGNGQAEITIDNSQVFAKHCILDNSCLGSGDSLLSITKSNMTTDLIECMNSSTNGSSNITLIDSMIETASMKADTTSPLGSGNITLQNSQLITSGKVFASSLYTMAPSSSLQIKLASDASHGLIQSKNIHPSGSLIVDFTSGSSQLSRGAQIPIAISENPLTGQFASHTFINTPNSVVPHLFYTTNDIYVILQHSPSGHKINAFNTMAVTEETLRLQRHITHLHTRLKSQRSHQESSNYVASNESVPKFADLALIPEQRREEQLALRMNEEPSKPWSVYVGPIGSIGHVNEKNDQLGNSFVSAGVLGGIDYAWMKDSPLPFGIGIGTSVSFLKNWSDLYRHAGNFDIDYLHANGYAVFVPKSLTNLSINTAIGGGHQWIHTERTTTNNGQTLKAKGKTTGTEFDALIGLEYLLVDEMPREDTQGLRFIFPVINLQYASTSHNGYKENGASVFNLKMKTQTWSALWSFAGTRASYFFCPSKNVLLRPEISFGWQRQWNHSDEYLSFSDFAAPFPQSQTIVVHGPEKNSLIFGLDFNCTLYRKMFIELEYDLIYNTLFLDNKFYLQFAWMW